MRRAVTGALVFGAAVVVGVAARQLSPADPGSTASPASTVGPGVVARAAVCPPRVVSGEYQPDASCTPGAVNDAVTKDGPPYTQTLYASTICKPGWASAQRKALFPLAVSERVKAAVVREAGGYAGASLRGYELDHWIPVSLGGEIAETTGRHPNLWAQNPPTPNWKDRVEAAANREVCSGLMPLPHVQELMRRDPVQLGVVLGVLEVHNGRVVDDKLAPTGGSD